MSNEPSNQQLMNSVAQSTSYNVVLQVLFRGLTFVLNAIVLRFVSADLLGLVNVRLTLLYSTTLFVCREAFRKACLSRTDKQENWQEVISVSQYSAVLGLFIAPLISLVWLFWLEKPETSLIPSYNVSVLMFALSAWLELLIEPLWITAQKLLYVRLKVLVEGVALLCRVVLTVILLVLFPDSGLLAFTVAQICYSIILALSYALYFIVKLKEQSSSERQNFPFTSIKQLLLPGQCKNVKSAGGGNLWGLSWSFFKQSILKQLLTEGERYMMTVFSILSFADQGVFDLICNLGSLVARFLFLPLEESCYLLFSKCIIRGEPAQLQNPEKQSLCTDVFVHVLKSVQLISLVILTLGYSFADTALAVYGGQSLAAGTGPGLLRWYCLYVMALAVNGITECFSFAVMSKSDVDRYNYKMLIFSLLFLAASFVFTSMFGSVGFILANCCNMLARIVHSIYIITIFYGESRVLWSSLPRLTTYTAFVLVFFTLAYLKADGGTRLVMSDILYASFALITLALCIYSQEKTTVMFVLNQYILPLISKTKKTQ